MLSLRARLLGAITGLLAVSAVLAAGPAIAGQTAHLAADQAAPTHRRNPAGVRKSAGSVTIFPAR